jgi:protein-L-isoaspartate O-methyltransferase
VTPEAEAGPLPATATPEWEAAFRGLPRPLFLPELIWPFDGDVGAANGVHRETNPAAWQAAADSDAPIITQWDDGEHQGEEPGELPTSSASAPSLVASMLADLDVHPGMRALEIGTGTGWNAALMAHRLGDEAVVTVEVDPDVAEQARVSLKRARRDVRVITGDGAEGWPAAALYDRVIATCGLRRIPAAWLEQTRAGGIILVPWGSDYSTHDALVRLTVGPDGTASGPFLRSVEFMKLRAQRFVWPGYPKGLPISDMDVPDAPPSHERWTPFARVAGLLMRDAAHAVQQHDDGYTLWLYSLRDTSWTAAVRREGIGPGTLVRRAGERRLWDELITAHAWWTAQGEPGVDRFGLTVTPEGEQVWLDDPGRPVVA